VVTLVTTFVMMVLLFAVLVNLLTLVKGGDKTAMIGTALGMLTNIAVIVAVLYLAAV
jgi:hypothetical protein